MPPETGRRWADWANHVLSELERQSNVQEDIRAQLTEIEKAIATLKVKSGVWGMIGGAIPVAIGVATWMLYRLLG